MAQNQDWMSRTLAGQADMCANIRAKIAGYEVQLDLNPIEVTTIQNLCLEFIAMYEYTSQTQATTHGIVEWRDQMFYGGPKGSPATPPPAFAEYTANPAFVVGIIPLIRDWRERWVAASGYTQAIGEDLMIVKAAPENLNPNDVQPTIQVFGAQADYLCSIIVANRAESDQWIVETRKKGGEWVVTGTFTGKSADFSVAPTVAGEPFQLEVRVQLRRKNANYGQLSQTATVTLNP